MERESGVVLSEREAMENELQEVRLIDEEVSCLLNTERLIVPLLISKR